MNINTVNTMAAGKRRVTWKIPSLTADWLKNFACIVMLIQTIGVVVIEKGIINLDKYTQVGLSQAMAEDNHLMFMAGVGSIMQLVGGLAVPIFAFLLVEGFLNTSDYRKYLLSIIIIALVSEIPYDFAMSRSFFDWSSQNTMVSVCICLFMLYFLQMFSGRKEVWRYVIQFIIVFCAVLWVTLFKAQYGLCMVLLVAVFYLLYARHILKTVIGVIVSLLYVTGPLSFYIIWCYNGQRKNKIPKYIYYIFYPLHLLVLGIIAYSM